MSKSLVAWLVENRPVVQESTFQALGKEDPLEKEMAIYASILAWRIPWTEEPGGLQSMRVKKEFGHNLVTKQQLKLPPE